MSLPEALHESLPHKIVRLHETLTKHDIPYAFGGAIALGYHSEPRATSDIDVNIFVSPDQTAVFIEALGELFTIADTDALSAEIRDRDQAQAFWGRY